MAAPPGRLVALDVFRGVTIAGMILVNNPGSWDAIYRPLGHAEWHGLTPTDLVFPFFLFIVGVALPLSLDRRSAAGASRLRLFEHVVRRSLIIFLLGLILAGLPRWPQLIAPTLPDGWRGLPLARLLLPAWPRFEQVLPHLLPWRVVAPFVLAIVAVSLLFVHEPPLGWPAGTGKRVLKGVSWVLLAAAGAWFIADFEFFHASSIRVPGVLQRIALCYLVASAVVLLTARGGLPAAAQGRGPLLRVACIAMLLVGYWAIVRYVPGPVGHTMPNSEQRPEGVLHDAVDVRVFGHAHLYRERPDPEGLLSTLPAIATVLLGVLTGSWLRSGREPRDLALGLFLAANVLLVLGLWWALDFPLNKKIWTSSYVLVTGGLALHFLAMCVWLVDIRGQRRWAAPFLVFGTNAIAVYFASSAAARWIGSATVTLADGRVVSVKQLIFEHLAFAPAGLPVDQAAAFSGTLPPATASLLMALAYVAIWCVLFVPLYRAKVFIKI